MCKLFSLSQGLQISEIKKTRNTRKTIKEKNESNFSLDTTQEMSTVKLYSTNDGLINSDNSNTESQTSGQDTLLGIKQHDTNCVMFDNESNVDNLLLPLPQALDKHAPVVKKRVKRDRQPEWYNSEIIYARNMRDKYNALGLWSEYRFWRNKTKQIVDNSKKNYYKNMVKDSNDPKTLWKCLHSLNPKVKNTPYELATEDNNTTKSKKCIADTFNNFFTSCAEKLREQGSYTPVNKADFSNLSKFVKNKLHKHEKFSIPPVNMNELFNELAKLDINKASGMDNIGPKILRLSAPFIASPLTYIFNRMIDTGIYPSLLKNAKVTPVFKDGDKLLATNYRPISVLPTLSKLIERHVSNKMLSINRLTKVLSAFPLPSDKPNLVCYTKIVVVSH
ncbi:unnamed protein product [Mytilus edulis]|uniref:Uncharacterized protein n=1 Tax=Mytilus edulis TaxID=6550 RepID=A0A8S3U6J9_MYTED|nr:unnamed protein product [Mytilus edulis]